MLHGLLFTIALSAASCAHSVPIQGPSTNLWRWPYTGSPYVVTTNPRDHLPDFDYFDMSNASLTPHTIACPAAMQEPCSSDTHKVRDEKCGADGLHQCHGGLYCAISHDWLKGHNLTDEFFPHYIGKAKDGKAVPRTRRNILQRAIGWLATHAPYFGCRIAKLRFDGVEMCAADDGQLCPQRTYTLTCEGLIAMAYGSPSYGGGADTDEIPHSALLPGDSITVEKYDGTKHLGTAHFLMFREWIEVNQTARLYQMGGEHGTANMVASRPAVWCANRKTTEKECWGTHRFKHIVPEEPVGKT